MNRDYPLAESPNPGPRPKPISLKRAYEVADSLENVGYKKIASAVSSRISKSDNKDLIKSGWADVNNASRYRSLANKKRFK